MVLTYNLQVVTETTTIGTTIDTVFVNPLEESLTININMYAISANGQRCLIKRIDATGSTVVLIPNGSDTMASSSSQQITAGQVVELVSNGTNWEFVLNVQM